jgi:Flp pilus assembly protein TadG
MKMLNDLHGRISALMNDSNRATPSGKARLISRSLGERVRARRRMGEEGSNLIEFAFILPILLMLLTGILTFGTAMYQKQQLQVAVGQGVHTLAISQNMVSDPCGAATTVIQGATQLNPTSMTITFYNGGPPPTGIAMSGSTCAGLSPGTVVSAQAQYPCSYATIFRFTGVCQSLTAIETEPVP